MILRYATSVNRSRLLPDQHGLNRFGAKAFRGGCIGRRKFSNGRPHLRLILSAKDGKDDAQNESSNMDPIADEKKAASGRSRRWFPKRTKKAKARDTTRQTIDRAEEEPEDVSTVKSGSRKGTPIDTTSAAEVKLAKAEGTHSGPGVDDTPNAPGEAGAEPPAEKPGIWGKIWNKACAVWNYPMVTRFRTGMGVGNFMFQLPALIALVIAQIQAIATLSLSSLLASTMGIPLLAPLLFGTGLLLKKIVWNVEIVVPKMGLVVLVCWACWVLHHLACSILQYLTGKGTLAKQYERALVTISEVTFLVITVVSTLVTFGIKVKAVLLPVMLYVAFAAKDVVLNFTAGMFLFMVQPFAIGDHIAMRQPGWRPGGLRISPASARRALQGAAGGGRAAREQEDEHAVGWFEGECVEMDLRYTVLRSGRHRLVVPNGLFLNREFILIEPEPTEPDKESDTGEAYQHW